jgi:PIN domain nuclease of toxin-antitoxin system
MRKYLLDTHIIIWLVTESENLNNDIMNAIVYFENNYYVSIEALHEIITLQTIGKVDTKLNIEQIVDLLTQYNIKVLPIEVKHLKTLEKLSTLQINGKEHHDPSDRLIIAQAIAEKNDTCFG